MSPDRAADPDAREERWLGPIRPTDSRWEEIPHAYVRQEYAAYLSRAEMVRQAQFQSGSLTVVHTIRVFAFHTAPEQLSDHPCARGRHRHDYKIQLEVIAPPHLITDDASMRLRTAVAALERVEGPILGRDLDRLSRDPGAGLDERWLAEWVHHWVGSQLPPDLSEYLLVEVGAIGLATIPAVHLCNAL